MHVLYLDESGNEDNPEDTHFVLAGASIFEADCVPLAKALDAIQAQHFPGRAPIPFHAASMRAGKGFWRDVERTKRETIVAEVAQAIGEAPITLFGAVIEKSDRLYGERAVERAIEEVTQRFDLCLKRKRDSGTPQHGLVIFSEGRFHKRAKILVQRFRELGNRWGNLRNLSDIPYFASMKDTRLLQVADFVAHALFLLYERRDPRLVRHFVRHFDQHEGKVHGLVHHRARMVGVCACPACHSRLVPGDLGEWLTGSAVVGQA